ncbi:MAG: DUF72 domain-containing protein [Parachlamydiaceae bacterium]|nr:DUF72 domain-containing protein [Parachlamydiaceae bacterium]
MTNRSNTKVYVGTSGFSYSHWKENFYPKGLPTKKWLEYYSREFSTVELNTTFYHLPLISTVNNWQKQVSDNFIYAVKASRYMTHQKRLLDCKASVDLFYDRMKLFKTKAGPILFQLPPSFKMDKERLIEFIKNLKKSHDHVFEFRHESWYVSEIYEILEKNKLALCITDLNGKLSPEEITSNFTYLRLHGPKKAYQGSYGSKLKDWKSKIEKWSTKISVYCYFDNDEKGYAIQDAKTLKDMLL